MSKVKEINNCLSDSNMYELNVDGRIINIIQIDKNEGAIINEKITNIN